MERGSRHRRARRFALVTLGLLALAVAGVALLASSLAEEPVRRLVERRANERLRGYRVEVGGVDLHPLAFGFDVLELAIARNGHLDLPLAQLTELTARIDWRALLRGALVADVSIERPIVYIDRRQARREARDDVALHERGWQDALQAMIPLEINRIAVHDGEATYAADFSSEPLRLRGIEAEAENVRNVVSGDREYPSRLALDAQVFDDGRLRLRGDADFLAKPVPGVLADIELDNVALDHFQPILRRHHFEVRGGRLGLSGQVEWASDVRRVRLRELEVQKLAGDYVRTEASAAKEPVVAQKAVRAAREAVRDPELQLRADRIVLRDADVGLRNNTDGNAYRVFVSELALQLENFSNRFSEGSGRARLRGRFMGSGATDVRATFEPERAGPEFGLEVSIVDTQLTALNDVLRAHGGVDVAAGLFSLYSEVHVEDGHTTGYVKPLFRELRVTDPEQDRHDSPARKVYEHLVEGVGVLLENRARDEVATRTDLSGPLEDPNLDTWELIARLVQNAFFHSILPGLEHETSRRPPL